MNKCPITYQPCEGKYSQSGLAMLSPRLTDLQDLPFTEQEQRKEAVLRAGKMSIQGVQPKLSAKVSAAKSCMYLVDQYGTYIIKPPHDLFSQVPENEDLTMKMAARFGIDVPLTGLIYAKDGSFSYFIKRFDRYGRNKKYHVEDFAQLTSQSRETKYRSSMEKLIPVIEAHCTFPLLEKRKLFRRILFCFLTGNEDMHLKNFSLIRRANKVELSPAYDLLNTSIAIGGELEELALPLAGKKRKITAEMLFSYYAQERMGLHLKTVRAEQAHLLSMRGELEAFISRSFLTSDMKDSYQTLLSERYNRLT